MLKKIESVLNTDAFDKRRFKQIYNMSKKMQEMSVGEILPTFNSLLSDIWSSLFKLKPKLTDEEVPEHLQANKALMEKIMNDESFENYRAFTKLDDLSSAIGTTKFGEKVSEWLEEQKQHNEDLQKQMEEMSRLQNQLRKQEQLNGKGNVNENLQQDLEQITSDIGKQIQQILADGGANSLSKKMAQAMQETNEAKNNLESLLGGMNAGSGKAELRKVPLKDQISLAEKLMTNKKLKEIANWAGRFKQIARKKQKSKHDDSIDRSGVTIGNRIERLLPSELALYSNPSTKNDFLRRFAEGEIMEYEQKGREELGKGPIVLCLDQSGSMESLDTQSKGFTLALMSIAKKQKRDFCLILFSSEVRKFIYPKGKITTNDMLRFAEFFLNGGTDFIKPLREAQSVINESRFKKADIIFVTDGEDRLKVSFVEKFNKNKMEKDFNVLSLVIGKRIVTVKGFSDRVIQIKNFNDEGSFQAFEI